MNCLRTLTRSRLSPAADIGRFVSGLESALAVAERHGDAYHAGQCHELLSRAAFWSGDQDTWVRQLAAARESFLAAATPWAAARAEAVLAELALRAGDAEPGGGGPLGRHLRA